ncbi:hypothetical protein ACFQAT_24480 [Undibacterium arcticum]|uniref:hypothetical protein n=1 Tax=Undibacterium arcticum TaxID=1762892 RepID=UPI003611A76C
MASGTDASNPEEFSERPWIDLTTTYDVEAWIDHYNWDLQRCIKKDECNGVRRVLPAWPWRSSIHAHYRERDPA